MTWLKYCSFIASLHLLGHRRLSASCEVPDGSNQRRAATDLVAIQRDGLAVDCPVGIAFDNLAIGVAGKRTGARVADAGQRLAHDVGLRGGDGFDAAAVTGGVA